ncbi:hypothetical protein [Haloferula sp.]|uniref:hypothetical protein n=1 Tax=Haloferula sp. TaxID=2497595 RepID=UPI00329BA6B3
MRRFMTLLASALLTSCDPGREDASELSTATQLEPTTDEVIDQLIAKGLLRVDINFTQVRSSPEFKDDDHIHWSDSEIACTLDLHNFSTKDLRLPVELFTHYDYIDIDRDSGGEGVASLSATFPAGSTPSEYFDLPPDTTNTFGVQYTAFECFHGVQTKKGGVRYEFPGDFVIYHRRFPSDRLKFSVDAEGIVRPSFDMKIQDGVEPTKPEQGAAPNP